MDEFKELRERLDRIKAAGFTGDPYQHFSVVEICALVCMLDHHKLRCETAERERDRLVEKCVSGCYNRINNQWYENHDEAVQPPTERK